MYRYRGMVVSTNDQASTQRMVCPSSSLFDLWCGMPSALKAFSSHFNEDFFPTREVYQLTLAS